MDFVDFVKSGRSNLPAILGQQIYASTKVHGVFIPASKLQGALHRFVRNLVLYTHDPHYKVQLIGSATGLAYRENNFLVCTMHQLKGANPKDVGIILSGKDNFISSAGFTCFRNPDPMNCPDYQDLCALDFTDQVKKNPELGRHFFEFGSNVALVDDDEVFAYLAYGCAFSDQKYNIVDENHLGLVTRSITCEPGDIPSDPALGQCKLISKMGFDPNGLSGGPVFATVVSGAELVLKFAGIANRSGGGIIHFIKAKAVQNLLNLSFE
jgi:hypothetical protein